MGNRLDRPAGVLQAAQDAVWSFGFASIDPADPAITDQFAAHLAADTGLDFAAMTPGEQRTWRIIARNTAAMLNGGLPLTA